MINREITYERDVNKSYMKIPAVIESCLDEKLMFKKIYQGIVPMEKCFLNGSGQYWYNISGKQALDAYCRVNTIDHHFFENLILRICNQLEILEWNLIDSSCLVVEPELIFLNHSGEEVSFVLYPSVSGNFLDELQQLMEYLLTKINHEDQEGVRQAYRIYDMTLQGAYSIKELKQLILSGQVERAESIELHQTNQEEVAIEMPLMSKEEVIQEKPLELDDLVQGIEEKLLGFVERVKGILQIKKDNKEEIPMVVYPDEEDEEEVLTINPTVCLAATLGETKGMLLYEGIGDYPDFDLGKAEQILGKNPKVTLYINRETISQFHAKLDYFAEKYYVEDLNSTNGTYVNDELLNYKEKRVLSPGDVLRFADVKYRFL